MIKNNKKTELIRHSIFNKKSYNLMGKITKKILSFTTAVIICSAVIPSLGANANSNFIVSNNTYDSTISINRFFIRSAVTFPSNKDYSCKLSVKNKKITTSNQITTTPGMQMILSFNIEGVDVNTAKDLKLFVTSYSNNRTFKTQEISHSDFIDYSSNGTSRKIYNITYKFESLGEEISFETGNLNISSDNSARCMDVYLKDDPNYVSVKCMAPDGFDGFIASAPYVSNVSKDVYRSWGEEMCMFINSLSDMTGINQDIVFFRETPPGKDPQCFFNSIDTTYYNAYPIIYIDSYAYGDSNNVNNSAGGSLVSILKNWNYNAPVINQEELHELSHAYGLHYDPNKNAEDGYGSVPVYDENIAYRRNDFTNYYNMNADDIFTNARGCAAIQHCSTIRDDLTIVNVDNTVSGSYATYCLNEWNDIYQNNSDWDKYSNSINNDVRAHWFNTVIVELANERNNWAGLQKFFGGEQPKNVGNNSTNIYSTFLGEYLGVSYSGVNLNICKNIKYSPEINESKVKLANTTYRLYQIFQCVENNNFDKYSYIAFLNNYFNNNSKTHNSQDGGKNALKAYFS